MSHFDPYLPTPAQTHLQARTPPPPPPQEGQPRGNGMISIASIDQFVAQMNTSTKQYWSMYDEALQNSRENAYRMTLDPIIWPSMNVRCYPTALLPGDAKAEDEEVEEELSAAKRVTQDVRSLIGLASMRSWLLRDGIWSGVSGAQIVWNWVSVKGKLRMRPVDWSPVMGDSLSFDYGGWPAIRVRSNTVVTEAQKSQLIASEYGMIYRLTPEERECMLIHRVNPEASDYFKPQNARTVVGSGLRGRLYWLWALKSQIWQMGLDWLRWFSKGFTVWYYQDGNPEHMALVQEHVRKQDGSHAMLYPIPRDRSGQPYFEKPFEHIAPSNSNAQFIQQILTSYLDDLIRFGILHQSLTTQVGPTGFGSGAVAANHKTTFDNVVKMDALQLDDSFTRDLVRVCYRVNEPHVPPGRWVSQIDSPNVEELMQSAKAIVSLGGSVPLKPLTEAAGIPEAKDGETLLGGLQQGSPSAVASIPDNTPMVGANPTGLQPAQ